MYQEQDLFEVKPPTAKFDAIGDEVKGTITDLDTQPVTDFDTGELKHKVTGEVALQGIVTLDDSVRVFCKPQIMFAIKKAIRDAGEKTLRIGGALTVKYSADEPSSKKGVNPTKLFEAVYLPPAAEES